MNTESLNYYDQYVDRIDRYKKYGYDIESSRDFLLSKAEPLSGNILEIGTGKGYLTVALAKKGCYFTSIDISKEEQVFTYEMLNHFGLADRAKLTISDAKKIPYNNGSCDIVISCNTLHHMNDLSLVIDEIMRILKPRGKIILSDFNNTGLQIVDEMHRAEGNTHEYAQVNFNDISAYLDKKGFKVLLDGDKHHNILIAKK